MRSSSKMLIRNRSASSISSLHACKTHAETIEGKRKELFFFISRFSLATQRSRLYKNVWAILAISVVTTSPSYTQGALPSCNRSTGFLSSPCLLFFFSPPIDYPLPHVPRLSPAAEGFVLIYERAQKYFNNSHQLYESLINALFRFAFLSDELKIVCLLMLLLGECHALAYTHIYIQRLLSSAFIWQS